jgi:heat shock protein HtpX
MRRLGARLAMLAVGLAVATLYLGVAAVLVRLLVFAFDGPRDVATTVATVGVVTVLVGYLSYRFGTTRTLAGLDATELDREQAPGLFRRLDDLCAAMGVDQPRVLVAELGVPNAFTLGGGRRGVIVVDRSLFRLLDRDEFETILAHELAHLAGYDSLLKTLAYSAIQTATGVAFVVVLPVVVVLVGLARGLAWARGRPLGWDDNPFVRIRRRLLDAIGVVLFVLTLVLFAHSRRREFVADDRAARVTGKPLALASALQRLEAANDRWLLSSLTVRGTDDHPLTRWFATHPSTEDRVERLVERAERQRRTAAATPRR